MYLQEGAAKMNDRWDRWLKIAELSSLFGVSEDSIRRLSKSQGFPLRRLTPYAMPGVLESELFRWLKSQPNIGRPVRSKAPLKRKPRRERK